MPDRPALETEEIEITPEMIEAGVAAAWQEPAPPPFLRCYVERIYRAMAQSKPDRFDQGLKSAKRDPGNRS